MTGETRSLRLVDVRAWVALSALVYVVACAKSDVQAPAKEAPSAPAAVQEQAEEPALAPAPPNASGTSEDRWPAAEARPNEASGAGGAVPKSAPAPVIAPGTKAKSDDAEKKSAPRSRASAAPAKGEAERSSMEGAADSAEPALAAEQAWSQLAVAYDELTEALALSVPDCGAAARFRENVCALAERICTIERDLPSTTPHKCTDGRQRCSDATSRYNAKCDR